MKMPLEESSPVETASIMREQMKYAMREYMALFQLKTKPAAPRMKKLKNMTISPTENDDRLSIQIATISVPSVDPPFLMTMPTPSPMIIPPKIVDRKGSFVAGIIFSSLDEQRERTMMANMDDAASLGPKLL